MLEGWLGEWLEDVDHAHPSPSEEARLQCLQDSFEMNEAASTVKDAAMQAVWNVTALPRSAAGESRLGWTRQRVHSSEVSTTLADNTVSALVLSIANKLFDIVTKDRSCRRWGSSKACHVDATNAHLTIALSLATAAASSASHMTPSTALGRHSTPTSLPLRG